MNYWMMLVLSVLATICGTDNRVAIEDFGQANQDWLQAFLPLPNGMPSHDTVGRCWRAWMPSSLKPAFWTGYSRTVDLYSDQGQLVTIAGKSVRHSRDAHQGQSSLHLEDPPRVYRNLFALPTVMGYESSFNAPPVLPFLSVDGLSGRVPRWPQCGF